MSADTGEPVFTPVDPTKPRRLRFRLADVEVLHGDLDGHGLGKKAQVRIHGVVYDVYGKACDLPCCQCDAYIVRVD
jgi:hypothetical protein